MEVVSHGNTYKQIRCPQCNAILAYSKTDIITHSSHEEPDLYLHEWDIIKCLDCGNNIILDERKIEI